MRTRFFKMHGAGNDFVLFDRRGQTAPLDRATIAALCDRHQGIGCDTLVLLEQGVREPDAEPADVAVRFFNHDGSDTAACGNATRCVADWLHRTEGLIHARIGTAAGLLRTERVDHGLYRVDMGAPRLDAAAVGLARDVDTLHLPLEGDPAACSMGNPHATWFVDDLDCADIATLGPAREHDPLFAQRANIGFAQILSPERIRLRVWERGTGLTRACGTGACAALVNAHRRGRAGRTAALLLDGGTLTIEWAADDRVWMTGPARFVFEGAIDLDAVAR